MVWPSKLPSRGDVVVPREERRLVLADGVRDLVQRPDVEFPLLAFAVGIERGGEGALLGRHLAREPADGLLRARAEQRIAGTLMRERQQLQQLRIVVEHLLEMRHQPALVDRIAGKPAAEMIVDAALADALERDLDRGEVALLAGALPCPPQKFEHHAIGKFRRAADAAMHGIDQAAEPLRGAWSSCVAPDDDLALRRSPSRRAAAISALRFCSMLCGSSRNTRATSRSTSTKAGLP